MQVEKQNPGAVLRADGHTTDFCSEHCRDRYRTPSGYLGAEPAHGLPTAHAREGHNDA